jgi:hypothetical protein
MNNTTIRFVAKIIAGALIAIGGKDVAQDQAQVADAIMIVLGLVAGVWSFVAGKIAEKRAK